MSEPSHTSCGPSPSDLEILQSTTAADFDGHTEFQRLSPPQRLAWLDEAVAFITAAKSSARVTSLAPDRPTKSPSRLKGDNPKANTEALATDLTSPASSLNPPIVPFSD